MQYSPYSAIMNPYQTIYNNGGSAAYQPTWGYTDAIGHMFNTNAVLPLGYTRQQYNEERALAAESMWKSPLMGLSTFGMGTLASYAIWGSPFQDLASKVGGVKGATAFDVGFSGLPNKATLYRTQKALDDAISAAKKGVVDFRAGNISRAELKGLFDEWKGAGSVYRATRNAAAFEGTFWHGVGQVSSFWNNTIKGDAAFVTEKAFSTVGTGVSKAFEATFGGTGRILESQLNKLTGNVVSPWMRETGASLFEATESGWMARSLSKAKTITAAENKIAKLLKEANSASSEEAAGIAIRRAEVVAKRLKKIRGSYFESAKRGIAGLTKNIGSILKNGGGVSGLMAAGGGAILNTGLSIGGAFASAFFNPVTMAEFYMLEQAVGYGVDAYQNYQTENEIKRNLMAKGNRILQYGFADGGRGLQAGLSVAQQDRLVSKMRDMAAIGAGKGDLFGAGAYSLFGGHARYSERLRELKSILSVGTDMGFFDMSRSMDDFEKKFEQTVKTVDKLSKLLKRTKGEIMTVMANVQNTEGLYDMNAIGASVRKKDFAARISGVDLTTAMQESATGAQMSRQFGFSASLGASIMSDNRVMMNRAVRSGDITREELFRLGGEQGVLVNMQQGMLNLLHDESFRQELAMNYELDAKTGRYVFKGKRLERLANASDAELRKMHDERYLFANERSYSRRKYAKVQGGRYYDISRDMQADLASGKISQEQMTTIVSGLILQRHAMLNPGSSSIQREEALAQGLQEMGIDYEVARIMAKNQMGGYNQFKAHDEMMVAVDRYRDAYDKSGMGFSMLMNTGFSMIHSRWGTGAAIGGGILGGAVGGLIGAKSGHAWGGAMVGAGIGGYVGRAALTGSAILLNSMVPASDIATSMRNDLKASFMAQGINPNFVDSYLLGPSDEEKVASMKQGYFSKKLSYLVRKGMGADTTSVNSGSDLWKTLAAGFESIGSPNKSRTAKGYAEAFLAANRVATSDMENTLEGVLNVFSGSTEAQLEEYGIKKEDAVLLSQISTAIRKGDTIDLTAIDPSQINRVGEMLGVAFSVAGSDKLYENKQKLMSVLQISKDGTTEFEQRNKIFRNKAGFEYMKDYTEKVGWLSTMGEGISESFNKRASVAGWLYNISYSSGKGLYRKLVQGVTNRAEVNYLDRNADTSWQSIRNRARARKGLFDSTFGYISDLAEYYVSNDSRTLSRLKEMASNISPEDVELLENAINDPNTYGAKFAKNLGKFKNYYKEGDVAYEAMQQLALGNLTGENRKILETELYGIHSYMDLEAVSRIAGKVLETDDIKKREYVLTAARLFTPDDQASAKEAITKMGAAEFVKALLNDKNKGLTEAQKSVFLNNTQEKDFMEKFSKMKAEDQIQAIFNSMEAVMNLSADAGIQKKTEEMAMNAENEKNATVLTDQAMKDFKEGSLIIRDVAARLGFY